jgi:hypothetical protein
MKTSLDQLPKPLPPKKIEELDIVGDVSANRRNFRVLS